LFSLSLFFFPVSYENVAREMCCLLGFSEGRRRRRRKKEGEGDRREGMGGGEGIAGLLELYEPTKGLGNASLYPMLRTGHQASAVGSVGCQRDALACSWV